MTLIQQQLNVLRNEHRNITDNLKKYIDERDVLLLDHQTLEAQILGCELHLKSLRKASVVSLSALRDFKELLTQTLHKLQFHSQKLAQVEQIVAKEQKREQDCKARLDQVEALSLQTAKVYQFPRQNRDD